MDPYDAFSRGNAEYIEQLHEQYLKDPRNVEPAWQAFFAGFEVGYARSQVPAEGVVEAVGTVPAAAPRGGLPTAEENIHLADLIHSYRELGHVISKLDPLGHDRATHPLLELSEFGLTEADLDRKVGANGFMGPTDGTLRDLIAKLRQTYCGSIGVQFMEISDKAQREWLIQRMEPILNRPHFAPEELKNILFQICAAQGFEEFLSTKYVSAKRFGLEGGEAMIPLLNAITDYGATLGVDEIVMGMAHRGRLNTLAHVLNKPYESILAEFEGKYSFNLDEGDGDVKYHLGYSQDRTTPSGQKIHLALSFNPSHLELVNPVVEGIVRAKQYARADNERTHVVPLLIHGDAAFCGQGIVQETLALSEMPYWRTGGTIHIVLNNQIGFTTMPKQGRFTPYPTDVAKMIQAPIFHVNGDDPEACVWVAKLAIAFRQKFHCDVMIDVWCYRRNGHNEADEPSYTQPVMYREINAKIPLREMYAKALNERAIITPAQVDEMKQGVRTRLENAQAAARESRPTHAVKSFGGVWKGISRAGSDWSADTRISKETALKVGGGLTRLPEGFTVHPKLKKLLAARVDMSQGKAPIDWGGAEMFALGGLVLEGTPIRFVGQDAQRGTFSHRHSCLHDFNDGKKYYPLANLSEDQAPIIIVNTMLSELAVLGFEYGFSSADPRNLVIWEAQFGDFVNGTQAMLDQFIVAAESKWQKYSGLVMLLPHGYEGQGPEHSNAYVERFLALCAENNIQVVIPSMPAQYFHVLRRQMKRNFRKPLVMFMPKSLLRLEASTSRLEDLTESTFQAVLDDPTPLVPQKVRRICFCTGKVFFTLDAMRKKEKVDDIALVRVEQLYPFPQKEIQATLAKYRNATEVCWVQEEPRNRGAFMFMRDRLEPLLPESAVFVYVGREEAASPATGSFKVHQIEEEELVAQALDLAAKKKPTEAPTPSTNGTTSSNGTASLNGNGQTAKKPEPEAVPVAK